VPLSLLERLKSNLLKKGDCWIWQGAVTNGGYGSVSVIGQKGKPAHRAMYEVLVGVIPSGKELDHLCRVKLCVNPQHLEVVTKTENMRRRPATKLTVDAVKFIRQSKLKQKELAEMFGVNSSQISRVIGQKRWKVL